MRFSVSVGFSFWAAGGDLAREAATRADGVRGEWTPTKLGVARGDGEELGSRDLQPSRDGFQSRMVEIPVDVIHDVQRG